jgi:hypothetical protein
VDIIKIYNSLCKSCHCHPRWHTQDGVCHYNKLYSNTSVVKIGTCDGCEGYKPTDNLEYLEQRYEKTLSR